MRQGLCLYPLVCLFMMFSFVLGLSSFGFHQRHPFEIKGRDYDDVIWQPKRTATNSTAKQSVCGENADERFVLKGESSSYSVKSSGNARSFIVRLTVECLNFFVAKSMQFRHLSPQHSRPPATDMLFWFSFATPRFIHSTSKILRR
ncbi:hypothetical protein Syun_004904 [Stephania yunnanensis]|uniref:Secreted protein n=1 Tax=Stephania yunnanensis TaxID=152371 RepID=A0AAP0Q192_9MAGN